MAENGFKSRSISEETIERINSLRMHYAASGDLEASSSDVAVIDKLVEEKHKEVFKK